MKLLGIWMMAAALAFGQGSAEVDLKAAMHKETVEGDLKGAIAAYRKIVTQHGKNRAVAAQAMLQMAQCHEKLGGSEARKIYEQLVREYGDQSAIVAQAKAKLGGGAQLGLRRTDWIRPGCMEVADGGRLKICGMASSLLVIDMMTGKESRITDPENDPSAFLNGMAAPDGVRIALRATNPKEGKSVLYVTRLGDEKPRNLGQIVSLLAWSPDSRQVLVTTRTQQPSQAQLELVSVSDGSRRVLGGKLQVAVPEGAIFSPDGARIVYATTYWGAPADLRIHTIATGEDVPLVTKQGDARVVGWHKDGWLFYLATPTGVRDLFRVKMQGAAMAGAPEILQRSVDARVARLGPDGNIYYMLSSNVSNTYRATLNDAGNAFTARPVIASQRAENVSRFGRYSRDGKWLAYDTGWRGTAKLVVQNLETGEERERLSPFARINSLEWYPDGSALLVHGQLSKETPFGLFRFDLLTSEVKTVLVAKGLQGDLATNPTFLADGRSVLLKYWDVAEGFNPDDATRAHLARLDLASGQLSEVFRPQRPVYLRLFALSPEGDRIVYGFRDGKVDGYAVVSMAGGQPREILRCKQGETARAYSGLSFTGDGKGVVLHRATQRMPTPDAPANETDELWHIPLDGGEPALIHDTLGWTLTIMGRPHSREIAWQAGRVLPPEFWVMENVTTASAAAR